MLISEDHWTPPSAWCPKPGRWRSDRTDPEGPEWEVSYLLGALVRALQPDVVVETGTAQGATAVILAEGLTRNRHGHLWTVEIDPTKAEIARRQLAEWPCVTQVHADTREWKPPTGIDLAWIDSGPAGVRAHEVFNWADFYTPGAVIAVHDTAPNMGRDATRHALNELAADLCWPLMHLRTPRGVSLLQKPWESK